MYSWPTVNPCEGGISKHQADALNVATSSAVGILAGSPGVGKTYVAAALIKAIISENGSQCVAACGPTGKCAVRLTESLATAGIALQASTIHRLLGVISAEDGGWEFQYNEACPLPHRFVIIDESSMIDTDLMASLFAARAPGTHFLFLGDHRQLAPVGHGCSFLDMQTAGVPTGELTEIRRNSGRIVQACAEIRDHHRFDVSPETNLEAGENLVCTEDTTEGKQLVALHRATKINHEAGGLWSYQVVVPVNDKSPLSRKKLNRELQALLNPTGEQIKGNPFRVGDKVINLKNGFFPAQGHCPEANENGELFVANGEQAEVIRVEPARTIVRLQSPQRLVVIPHGKQKESDGENGEKGSAGSWDLGYAITVHKSQGSEWPNVIVMLDEYPGAKMVASRNWIYTAISRAKEMCLMIGKKSTADAMVRRDGLRRKTFLAERIAGDRRDAKQAATAERDASQKPAEADPPVSISVTDEEWEGIFK